MAGLSSSLSHTLTLTLTSSHSLSTSTLSTWLATCPFLCSRLVPKAPPPQVSSLPSNPCFSIRVHDWTTGLLPLVSQGRIARGDRTHRPTLFSTAVRHLFHITASTERRPFFVSPLLYSSLPFVFCFFLFPFFKPCFSSRSPLWRRTLSKPPPARLGVFLGLMANFA